MRSIRLIGMMTDGREHDKGQHDQRSVPVPAVPRPGFVVIKPQFRLDGLETGEHQDPWGVLGCQRQFSSAAQALRHPTPGILMLSLPVMAQQSGRACPVSSTGSIKD